MVGEADAGNAKVTPDPADATLGTPLTLTATWTGLDPAQHWLGVITYADTDNATLLSIG